jgi:predicted ester cyclase
MVIPPIDKQLEITGITINRFSTGKVEEHWNHFDQLACCGSLG